jgi:hypothetical protein
MNVTSHESVLAALENRANRYSNRGSTRGADDNLVSWALDETGMINTSLLCKGGENNERIVLTEQQERIRITNLGVPEEVLQVHGITPGSKPDGVIRLIYKNVNGINNRLCNNEKVEKAKEIIDDLEADIVAYNEHHLNMQDKNMSMALANYSEVGRQLFPRWSHIMSTRILARSRKVAQASWL